ncbi:acyltransferase [bacterium SCSIO 12741]|nr:acyltransferase [bacterium SCSIO 12741]
MKAIIERIIRLRNPQFAFGPAVTTSMVIELFTEKLMAWARSGKLILRGRIPNKVLLGRGVQFHYLSKISLGRWVKIEDHVCLSALGSGKIKIGNNVGIGAFSRLIISTSFGQIGQFIHIGNNVGIGEFAYLGGAGGLTLGEGCIIGQYFSCHPENHHFGRLDQEIRFQGVSRQGINIGKNCWIGSKVTVLDGVTLGDGCVVAAGSVITKSFPANSVIAGVPARKIKERIVTPKVA